MALMNGQGHKWLTSSRMAHYQGLLCDNPQVSLETVQTLNPATFLSTEEGPPDNDCKVVMDKVYSSRPGLMDVPLLELKLFIDGSSFVQGLWQKAGFTVTTANDMVQAKVLSQGCSAQ
jgi:hypothetical protein